MHDACLTISYSGVAPNPQPNWSDYSIPTVRLPDGEVVMDSAKIAPRLESLKPTPSLHLDLDYHKEVSAALGAAFAGFFPIFGAQLVGNVVAEEDVDWFNKDRAARFGMTLQELEKQKGGEPAWESVRSGLESLSEVLRKHKRDQGPFLLGSEPSYGDIIVVAALHMIKTISEEGYERAVSYGKELREVYEAATPWLQKLN